MKGGGKFLGVRLVIAGVAVFCLSPAPGHAQVSPNIQTQANILSPPVTALPLGTNVMTSLISTSLPEARQAAQDKSVFAKGACQPTDEEIKKAAKAAKHATKGASALSSRDERELTDKEIANNLRMNPEFLTQFKTKFVAAPQTPVWTAHCKGQPSSVKVTFQLNPTYETNALKAGSNSSSDGAFNGNGGFLASTGLGPDRPFDLVYLNAQAATSRYFTYSTKSLDTLTEQAAYQYFIGGTYYDDKSRGTVPLTRDQIPSTSNRAVTFDTVSFGVLNQTTYVPTFRYMSANLLTPQITLARQNWNLDPGGPLCLAGSRPPTNPDSTSSSPVPPNKNPQTPANYCYYVDLALTVGQTFSEISTLENANVSASVTFGKRLAGKDWTVAVQAVVTPRYYQYVPGGRQDVLLQAGPVVTYSPAPKKLFANSNILDSVSFSVAANYFQNYSTIAKNSWNGVIIQPTLTIAFAPIPK
jgi:hypothetical protein